MPGIKYLHTIGLLIGEIYLKKHSAFVVMANLVFCIKSGGVKVRYFALNILRQIFAYRIGD